MDAFLTQQSINVLETLWNDKIGVSDITCNGYKPYNNQSIIIHEYNKSDQCEKEIMTRIIETLQAGKWLVCCISSQSLGERIKLTLMNEGIIDETNHRFYHGINYRWDDNGKIHIDNKNEDFKDVETVWANIKFLMYSSTLTIGVDCSETKFDTFINIFQKWCAPATQFIQGFARCRNFNDKEHHVYI